MAIKYATLEEVKNYIRISDEENASKLSIILDSINDKINTLTSATKTNNDLRLATCIWCEVIFNSLGDKYISTGGVAYSIGGDGIPNSVRSILDIYLVDTTETDNDEGAFLL